MAKSRMQSSPGAGRKRHATQASDLSPVRQLSASRREEIARHLQLDTLGLPMYRSPRCGKRGRDLTEQLAELERLGRKFAAEGRIEAAITELRQLLGGPARARAILKRQRRAGGK